MWASYGSGVLCWSGLIESHSIYYSLTPTSTSNDAPTPSDTKIMKFAKIAQILHRLLFAEIFDLSNKIFFLFRKFSLKQFGLKDIFKPFLCSLTHFWRYYIYFWRYAMTIFPGKDNSFFLVQFIKVFLLEEMYNLSHDGQQIENNFAINSKD